MEVSCRLDEIQVIVGQSRKATTEEHLTLRYQPSSRTIYSGHNWSVKLKDIKSLEKNETRFKIDAGEKQWQGCIYMPTNARPCQQFQQRQFQFCVDKIHRQWIRLQEKQLKPKTTESSFRHGPVSTTQRRLATTTPAVVSANKPRTKSKRGPKKPARTELEFVFASDDDDDDEQIQGESHPSKHPNNQQDENDQDEENQQVENQIDVSDNDQEDDILLCKRTKRTRTVLMDSDDEITVEKPSLNRSKRRFMDDEAEAVQTRSSEELKTKTSSPTEPSLDSLSLMDVVSEDEVLQPVKIAVPKMDISKFLVHKGSFKPSKIFTKESNLKESTCLNESTSKNEGSSINDGSSTNKSTLKESTNKQLVKKLELKEIDSALAEDKIANQVIDDKTQMESHASNQPLGDSKQTHDQSTVTLWQQLMVPDTFASPQRRRIRRQYGSVEHQPTKQFINMSPIKTMSASHHLDSQSILANEQAPLDIALLRNDDCDSVATQVMEEDEECDKNTKDTIHLLSLTQSKLKRPGLVRPKLKTLSPKRNIFAFSQTTPMVPFSSPKNTMERKQSPSKMVGLRNLGNSCYLNAALQMLSCLSDGFVADLQNFYESAIVSAKQFEQQTKNPVSTPPLLQEVVKNAMPLHRAILAVLSALQRKSPPAFLLYSANPANVNASGNVASAFCVKRVMDALTSSYSGNHQHDSHEFLLDLLDFLHDEQVSQGPLTTSLDQDSENQVVRMITPMRNKKNTPTKNDISNVVKLEPIPNPVEHYFTSEVQVCLTCNECGYSR